MKLTLAGGIEKVQFIALLLFEEMPLLSSVTGTIYTTAHISLTQHGFVQKYCLDTLTKLIRALC